VLQKVEIMKKLLCAVCLLLAAVTGRAVPLDSLFVETPGPLLPLLGRNERLNLLDLYKAGHTALTGNRLDGPARLVRKDSLSLLLTPGRECSWEMVCVDSTTLVLLRTVQLPAADTKIGVYDLQWRSVACELPQPAADDFLQNPDSLLPERCHALRALLRPLHVAWAWQPDVCAFRAEVSTGGLPAAEAAELRAVLRPLRYVWTGRTFRRAE